MNHKKEDSALFMVTYILKILGPIFSPSLEIGDDPYLLELINSLIEDIVNLGSCMERIFDEYPPYNVL